MSDMSLRRHWAYLKYILRHKWFVMVACRRVGAPFWLSIIHDSSKFSWREWSAYAKTFYMPDGSKQYHETPSFNRAWLHHQHSNKHHWQHWLLRMDSGDIVAIAMPRRYVLEMVADWMGAGRAITGRWECADWYAKNRDRIILHRDTRVLVDMILVPVSATTKEGEPPNDGE